MPRVISPRQKLSFTQRKKRHSQRTLKENFAALAPFFPALHKKMHNNPKKIKKP